MGRVIPVSFPTRWRTEITHGYVIADSSTTRYRRLINFCSTSRLVVKANSTVSTKKRVERHHTTPPPQKNSQNCNLGAYKVMETPSRGAEGWTFVDFRRKRKQSTRLETFRRSKYCVLHFVKSVRWRKLSAFNMTRQRLTFYAWHRRQ